MLAERLLVAALWVAHDALRVLVAAATTGGADCSMAAFTAVRLRCFVLGPWSSRLPGAPGREMSAAVASRRLGQADHAAA